MSPDVRYRKTLHLELGTGESIHLDGASPDGVSVLSHAHTDHLFRPRAGRTVCTPMTWSLASARKGYDADVDPASHDSVELVESGHIAGSSAARITDESNGRTYLYTGDVCTRDRFYLRGFEPPDADVLIIESTYGRPNYRFPPQGRLFDDIIGWLEETNDRIAVLFGYSLGRAQKLQLLAESAGRERVFVTADIATLNGVIEEHADVTFPARPYSTEIALEAGDVLVLPSRSTHRTHVDQLVESGRAVTAGFSGWAVEPWFDYRGGYDATFPLSDHCDFDELVEVVRTVDPEWVFTHHGYAEEFAQHLATTYGYDAYALKRNQSTLADF